MSFLSSLRDALIKLFNARLTRVIVTILPLFLGFLVTVYVQNFLDPVPILAFRMDIGIAALLFGIFLTMLLGAYFFGDESRGWFARSDMDEVRREMEESRRQFIRRLDHEIKNPLTGLQAALVNMSETSADDDRHRAGENARHALDRLKRLLTDLRKLAELEERPLERLPVDIPALLEEVTEAVQSLPAAQERKISVLISRVPWPFPPVTGDRDLLSLVFYNLLENALKFTTLNDSVEVRALEDGRAIVVEVADSGAGIPPAELPKIFEELYRGVNARGTEGSGLGLALTRRIVVLHDGALEVRSRQDDPRGTVFTVRLPVARK
ncbi:MAG: sensor histidine kinase [Chloroflexota bacterium]